MRGTMKHCTGMEDKLVEYLDGRAKPAERRAVEEHLTACAECRIRAEEFRTLWSALDDLPVLSPSPRLMLRCARALPPSPCAAGFWDWLPSPRLAFAVTALVVMSVWLSSMPRVTTDQATMETAGSPEPGIGGSGFPHDPRFAGARELRRAFQI